MLLHSVYGMYVCRWLLQTDKDHDNHVKHVGYRAMFEAVVSTGDCYYLVCVCVHPCVSYACTHTHTHTHTHTFHYIYRRVRFLQTKE